MARIVVTCGGESSDGSPKIRRSVKSVAAGKRAAKACSIEHRGYWADVNRNGITVAACINGRCYKGKGP